MFNKKENTKPKLGPSFPFMEESKDGMALKYDGIKFSTDGEYAKLTFMQGDTPIYAYTYEYNSNSEVTFGDFDGVVRVKIS